MNKYHVLLIVVIWSFLFGSWSFSQSQSYPFKQFPLPLDLPTITCLHEDHDGYIWIGTIEGLYRFDGVSFTYFGSVETGMGLGRESITTITEDSLHRLWVGARSGVYLYQKELKDFKGYASNEETYAYYIHPENDSTFLIHGIHGIYWMNTITNQWVKIDVGIDDKKIFAVQRGKDHDIWIGSEDIVRKYDLQSNTYTDLKIRVLPNIRADEKIKVHAMFLDSRDQLWINTWYKGVLKVDTRTNTIVPLDHDPSHQPHLLELFNPTMAEDTYGNIWLGSHSKGINIYQPTSGGITHITKGDAYGFGLTGSVFGVMADHEKNMWVRSDRALHYLSKHSPVPQVLTVPNAEFQDVMFIKFLSPDYAIAGSYFGLYGMNLTTGVTKNLNAAIQLPLIRDAERQSAPSIHFFGKNNFWITSPQGLRNIKYSVQDNKDPILQLEKLYPTRNSFWPSIIFPVNDSLIFIKGRSNTSVFAVLNTRTEEMKYHELPDSLSINQAVLHKNNIVYLGIRNKGLYSYNIISGAMEPIEWHATDKNFHPNKPVFYDLSVLSDGRYALCTENYGLLLFDSQDNSILQIDIAPIANTNIVFEAEEDANRNIWIQASNQMLFYNRDTKNLSKTNLSDSFKGQNPFYEMHEGKELYTVFEGSLYRIALEDLISKNQKPKLYMQDLKAGDRSLPWSTNEPIRLGYADNFINYSFTGIDYNNPDGIRYWYQIPEISNEWVALENRTSISTRLSPGIYHFVVKAANDAGLWSEEIKSPSIIITPPFWKSWWFITGIIAIAAGAAAYLIRLRQLKKDAELRLRNQIARDLHDDIGSTLSGIKIFSTIASDMSHDNKDLSSLLDQIRDKSDLMMQSMSDIVWSINPAYDSLHDMMIRLKQYMSEVLESQNIDVEVIIRTDLKQYKINLQHRKDLYLALKEIINNAAKHAVCTHVMFEVSRANGEIVFRIADDGIGMTEDLIIYGNGLKNIESRIQQINGKLKRESIPDQGTTYEIRVSALS